MRGADGRGVVLTSGCVVVRAGGRGGGSRRRGGEAVTRGGARTGVRWRLAMQGWRLAMQEWRGGRDGVAARSAAVAARKVVATSVVSKRGRSKHRGGDAVRRSVSSRRCAGRSRGSGGASWRSVGAAADVVLGTRSCGGGGAGADGPRLKVDFHDCRCNKTFDRQPLQRPRGPDIEPCSWLESPKASASFVSRNNLQTGWYP